MLIRFSTLLFCSFLLFPVFAIDKIVEPFDDPLMEVRYKTLLEELRCVVCQNQSLADSNAMLAQDLRNEVRELLEQGNSDEQVKTFLVKRYGEFVLYKPPFEIKTYLLWGGPAIFLLIAFFVMLYFVRNQAKPESTEENTLTEEEKVKLEKLMKGDK